MHKAEQKKEQGLVHRAEQKEEYEKTGAGAKEKSILILDDDQTGCQVAQNTQDQEQAGRNSWSLTLLHPDL